MKRKNTFVAAVGEMKHFLAGSALVLVLVTVVPALAQNAGSGGMGGGAPGGGIGGSPSGSMGGSGMGG
ncbi:MAG: hypothetical protein AAB606_02345, partial [Patescibacteria group bacterium]